MCLSFLECVFRNSQLMQIILIMVMVKKGTGAKSTLTNTAVRRKTMRITVRLPEIRSFWGILPQNTGGDKSNLQLSNKKKGVWNRKLSFSYNWVMATTGSWTDVRGLETGFLRSSSHSGKKCKKIKNRSCASSPGQVFCSWQKKVNKEEQWVFGGRGERAAEAGRGTAEVGV